MIRRPRCGSPGVVCGRYVNPVADHSAVLPCVCGAYGDGVAAVTDDLATLVRECGPLDASGDCTAEAVDEVGGADDDPARTRVFCPGCVARAGPTDWTARRGNATEDRLGPSPFLGYHCCGGEHLID